MTTPTGGVPQPDGYTADDLHTLADLLDRDPIFELVADAYDDTHSLEAVIAVVRETADRT